MPLGRHKLICGDARDEEVYAALMGEERADIGFIDPPYNVPIDGNVMGWYLGLPQGFLNGRR